MSGPVPSPSMNGMMGLFGTWRAPPAYPIRSPLEGTVACLYVAILGLVVQGGKPEKVSPAATGGPAASPLPAPLKTGTAIYGFFRRSRSGAGPASRLTHAGLAIGIGTARFAGGATPPASVPWAPAAGATTGML